MEERRRLAETAGIDSISELRAEFRLHADRNETFRLEGRVTGTVGQTCVVSLEPLISQVDEPVELIFAPPEQIAHLSAPVDDDDISERADPPEPIQAGIIDLGRVATDAFFLGINPYPRKPDAVLDLPPENLDPDDHPFAALKALKADGKPPER